MPLFAHEAARSRKTYVIAEMAWAHNGSLENAVEILRGAHSAGADAVGIHLTSLPDYMVRGYRCLDGQTLSAEREPQQDGEIYRYLERINLTREQWQVLLQEARKIGMDICAMCNDGASLEFARSQEAISVYAIASACFTESDFVRETAAAGKPLVLRIGGASLGEIEQTVRLVRETGNQDFVLLHGIQLYPTDVRYLNLAALRVLQAVFDCPVGLADHIDGGSELAPVLPLLALPYGATVIEKHITLDRELKHEDFEAALGVREFRRFVEHIRQAETAIGDGVVGALTPADLKYRRVSRKRIVLREPLSKGAVLSRDHLTCKRSDYGAEPSQLSLLVGRTLRCNVGKDEGVDWNEVL